MQAAQRHEQIMHGRMWRFLPFQQEPRQMIARRARVGDIAREIAVEVIDAGGHQHWHELRMCIRHPPRQGLKTRVSPRLRSLTMNSPMT